jgi:hypothetical protein
LTCFSWDKEATDEHGTDVGPVFGWFVRAFFAMKVWIPTMARLAVLRLIEFAVLAPVISVAHAAPHFPENIIARSGTFSRVYGNILTAIDRDIGRFAMSITVHREVEGLFR